MSDEIYLRVIKQDGNYVVVDQDGRRVARVRRINIDASYDSATIMGLQFIMSCDETAEPHINRRRGAMK